MKFIERTLPENEQIELPITFHWTHLFFAWLSLFALGLVVIGVVIFIAKYVEKWTTERALTNRRLIIKRGLIRRNTEEISCNRIEEVNLSQTIIQRIMGSGNILVKGVGLGEILLRDIDDPLTVQKKINELRQWED